MLDLPSSLPPDLRARLREAPDPLFDAFDREAPCRPRPLPEALRRRVDPTSSRRRGEPRARASSGLPASRALPPESGGGDAAGEGNCLSKATIPALALLFALLGQAACGDEAPAPVAGDAVLVQLRDPLILPAWSLPDDGGTPLLPIDSIGPDSAPPLWRVPVPPGLDARAYAASLGADPAVETSEAIGFYAPLARTPDDPRFADQWALPAIGAPGAWDATQGDRAVTVAVLDDGLALAHPDLAANLWTNPDPDAEDDGEGFADDLHGASFVGGVAGGDPSPDLSSSAPWHGTEVAGAIAAVGDNAAGIAGVAWRASLMGVRALGAQGGRSDDLLRALDYAGTRGARVINASWAGPRSALLEQAIARASQGGALVVAAAGNEGAPSPGFPASVDGALSVAALEPALGLAGFSNADALLAAPGVAILTTSGPDGYARADGTSLAAGLVSGAAALLFAARPRATAAEVNRALLAGAIAVPGVKAGRLDANRALASLESVAAAEPASLLVSNPRLELSGDDLTPPRLRTLAIRSGSGEPIAVSIASSASWLQVSRASFITPGRTRVSIDPRGLAAGDHQAQLSIASTSGPAIQVQVLFHQGPRSRAAALGAGCSAGNDGLIQIRRGSVCTLLAPGANLDARAPAIAWTLPDGTLRRGDRLTAFFPQRGGFSLQVGSGGDLDTLALAVE